MTDIFQQRYYRINKFLLSNLGQWPYQSRSKRFFSLPVILLLAFSQIVPQITAAVRFWDRPGVILESTPPLITDLVFVVKLTNLVANSDKMLKMLQRIKVDWTSVAGQPEVHMLREYAEMGRRFTIAYTVAAHVLLVLYMGEPLIPRIQKVVKRTNATIPKKFPIPIDYLGLDLDTYYNYVFAYMWFANWLGMLTIVAVDTIFIIQVQHACGMFAVVGHQLQRLANDVTEDFIDYSKPKFDPAFRHLIYCIKRHNEVIAFSEVLEASYTSVFLVDTGLNLLAISVVGFQTVLVIDSNPKEVARFIVFLSTMLVHLFFQSYFAQKLINHSEGISEYLCQAEWYRTSLATQRLFNLVTMRARVPCQLTAGKFMAISMENFASVLKTCLSYFTVLRSMQ